MPLSWSAQECSEPVVTAVASVMLATSEGTEESANSPLCPLPSWPKLFRPQQDMIPPPWSAQECSQPAMTAVVVFIDAGWLWGVLGFSVAESSELLAQLAVRKAVRVSRQKARKPRGSSRAMATARPYF